MFNIFSRFISWLRRIFHIRSEPKYKETEPLAEVPPEKKPIGITRPLAEIPQKPRKPYKKKAPTEERRKEHIKRPAAEKRLADLEGKKQIDLGDIQRKTPKSVKPLQQAPIGEEDKKIDNVPEEKQITTRVETPFVDLDLDEAKVFLVLPQQQFKLDSTTNNVPQRLDYKLMLNGENQIIGVKVIKANQGSAKVEEKRIEVEKSLNAFQVTFPDELQGRTYSYEHSNRNLYVFIATGNNRGRAHYLYDREGNINPVPKRDVWILLKEDFELETEPDVIWERWVWENYQPLHVNFGKKNELTVKNRRTGEEKSIPCQMAFSIEGEELISDDFKEQTPLFIGRSAKIKAPEENPSGWIIWIQNKQAGYRIVDDSWTGIEALELRLPGDLPCGCGEFQVDICSQDEGVPVETLFFRYLPFLQMEHQEELIVPDPCRGHRSEIIKVVLGSNFQDWELRAAEKIGFIEEGYQIELPPEKDILHFSVTKRGKPETQVRLRITIPRLKWRTSKHKAWNDKPLRIKRDELTRGEDVYLFVCTNDFDTRYDFLAILEANDQKLHEEKFTRKGITYSLLLNRFYDTIERNEDKVILRIEIRETKNDQLLEQADIIYFPEAVKEKPKGKSRRPPEDSFKSVKGRLHLKPLKKRYKNMKPNVKGGRGMRKGKGFSTQEIIEAGMSMGGVRRLPIPFDKRRKSAYPQNVETLGSLVGGEQEWR